MLVDFKVKLLGGPPQTDEKLVLLEKQWYKEKELAKRCDGSMAE